MKPQLWGLTHGWVFVADDENRSLFINNGKGESIHLLPCDVATIAQYAIANGVIRQAPTGNFDHSTKENGY